MNEVENIIEYNFLKKNILVEALTHPSVISKKKIESHYSVVFISKSLSLKSSMYLDCSLSKCRLARQFIKDKDKAKHSRYIEHSDNVQ